MNRFLPMWLSLFQVLSLGAQVFTETINLNVTSSYGGDFPVDNSNYLNVLAIGGVGAEQGLKVYKQNSGNSPTFLGELNWNDTYVFEMTDTNGNDPDGGIVFGGTGMDDIFDDILTIRGNGNVGIATTIPDSKLTVKGKIHAEEVKVDLSVPGPDYVFKQGYDLKSLEEVQSYIKEHGHLPNIPSAKQMEENGIDLGEMNMKLLEKIEELTLYVIELEKETSRIKLMDKRLESQDKEIEQLKTMIQNIQK
ncbi:MAG: hypothetical protein VXW38_02630 [Bacteroidota bacterium]|nr:hypothetical protein [Bacteroidota bacterium]